MNPEENERVVAVQEQPKKKKKSVKTIVYIIVFVAVTVLALYYVFKDDPVTTLSIVSKIQFFPLLIAFALYALTVFCDAFSLMYFTRLYNRDYKYRQALLNVIIGNFVGVLNKMSTTFIQAYTFTKQGVKGAHAASIVTMNFLMYQFTFTFYSLALVLIGYNAVTDITVDLLGGIHMFPLSMIGFAVACLFLGGMIIAGFCRPLHNFLLNTVINLLAKMKIVKNPSERRKSWALQFATYRVEMKRLSKHWGLVILSVATNVIKQVCMCALPYLVFWSLGAEISQLGFGTSFSAVGYLNLVSSVITIGAPEVGFQSVFNSLFVQVGVTGYSNYVSAANFIWRIITFYLPLIAGALCFLFYKGTERKGDRIFEIAPTTIYNMEAMHLYDLTDTSEYIPYKAEPRIVASDTRSEDEIIESFAEIEVNQDVDYERTDEEEEQLARRRASLAKVVAEADQLENDFKPDDEIESEVRKSLAYCREKASVSLEKKKRKRNEKMQKEMMKKQPDGTTVHFTSKGIEIEGPEIEEEKCLPTPEDEEIFKEDDIVEGGKE